MRVKGNITDMINFTRAFDSAWERMVVILFRPFDFGKWLIIGLSAFLAGLLEGGNGFNSGSSFNNVGNFNQPHRTANQLPTVNIHEINSNLAHLFNGIQAGVIFAIAAVMILFIIGIALVMYWLGARGQFLLLDNIVRNRGSVGWPWQHYARQANSLFVMYLLLAFASIVILLPLIVVAVVMCIPLFHQNRWPIGGEIIGFAALGIVYFAVTAVLVFVVFIFREFGVPLMFRNGLMARPAFLEVMRLVGQNPGNVALFVLLRIALAIAVGIISILACCVCCIGAIPYVGTVAILPALIYVRCFTLDCLAQLGPQYDIWTVDVPVNGSILPPPINPLPPLG